MPEHNESADVFRPDAVVVELGGTTYSLVFDLNAFCELEKIYPGIDRILQMLFNSGQKEAPDLSGLTYGGVKAKAQDVAIDGVPLVDYISAIISQKGTMRSEDTRNILWAGCIHAYTITDKYGEITGYTLSKAALGKHITFKNLRDVNALIAQALLRDLIPADNVKNEDAPPLMESPAEVVDPGTPRLVVRK